MKKSRWTPQFRRAYFREYHEKRYQERREAGLCLQCGKRPPVEGLTTCQPCRDRDRERNARRTEKRRERGPKPRKAPPVFPTELPDREHTRRIARQWGEEGTLPPLSIDVRGLLRMIREAGDPLFRSS